MIKEGSVVTLAYRLTNAAGEELDSANAAEPFAYLHGTGQIVVGLEKALEGAKVGTKKKVTVTPEEGYGDVEDHLRMNVKRDAFPPGQQLDVGMRFAAEVQPGEHVVFMVTAVKGDEISVDGNHPLAGETLNFDVEVLGVREATEEELSHGHVHGPGGHHHD